MRLIQLHVRLPQPVATVYQRIAISCFSLALFLATIRLGTPPDTHLDSSWTEVLAWATLNGAQWGRDIVFAYGPLGFLHGNASYVPGILGRFIIGQTVLTAAFTLITAFMLIRGRGAMFFLFALAYVCSYPWIPNDVSWAMTLLFGATVFLSRANQHSKMIYTVAVAAMAVFFGAIALIKFTLFILWILCAVVLIGVSLLERRPLRGFVLLLFFSAALLSIWIACGQELGNLPAYLHASLEISLGYGSAMGRNPPPIVDIAGVACIGCFYSLCLVAGYQARRDAPALVALALYVAAAFLAWRANFTRADHAHWFFAFMSLLPLALLSHNRVATTKHVRGGLILFTLACAMVGLYAPDVRSERWSTISGEFKEHFLALANPSGLEARRAAEWAVTQQSESLHAISERVGAATVDMFTYKQGVILLSDLNYSPRPVFQSYSAYTPYLARLNEAKVLGPQATDFVVMQLAAIDGRLPMGDDPLALVALLQRYRPIGTERGYLLLQRDTAVAPPAQIVPPTKWDTATLGEKVLVADSTTGAIVAFPKLDLSSLGQIYAMLLREPVLRIVIETDSGEYNYRFIRASGFSGFILSPLIRTTQDWARAQMSLLLPRVRSFRIEPESAWQDIFFRHEFAVGFQQRDYLHLDPALAPTELVAAPESTKR